MPEVRSVSAGQLVVVPVGVAVALVVHAAFGHGWWLNSGQSVAGVMSGLCISAGVVALWRWKPDAIAIVWQAALLWGGVFAGLLIVFARLPNGPGNIFPIVLFFAAVMSAVAVGVGWMIGSLLRLAARFLL